ncbi:putative secreted protein [Wickerhamomyces ciferrii]|uniref:Secreted protein n=1 Tax=Wickerhamomyces ciferrii (strain ATCC 14091 / BCRC 22168 / CBS 111 / JCM 3599 / NBRC 0793 / NRRL Y-1031 F-60-10) TaxID=1206466 RepID=K0KUW9_WICCF|nr:uncharacterized protein BN7_6640 [Wickerhamomyces ciferrii]CCH47031.1 putative secreted protein [Wickerhamomyces ciferrii]
MKLSSIFLQGLLLSGIMASPVATESSINTENLSLPGNFTDPIISEAAGKGYLCNDANPNNALCYGSVKKCIYMTTGAGKQKNLVDYATKICKFYCSELKSATQCKQSKVKANYHPKWKCDDLKYC